MTTLMTGQMPGNLRPVLDDDVDLVRDRALVERAQAGDRTAFDDLYQRYYRRLHRFCLRRLQDAHEAEDVAQEAFARAWRALPSFAGDRRFYPWLSVIASHLCTDVLRRRNRATPVAEFHQGNMASTEDGGEERVIAAVDCDLVAQAFLRLSDRHQRILNLREGSGWSYQAIADHEGVGITAIETLLWRARQALKREFASLAGSEGRLAGFLGGLLGLSFLRRVLAGMGHAARKLTAATASSWTTAAAVGSAAAVSAAAVAGGVLLSQSSPRHDTPVAVPQPADAGGSPAGAIRTPPALAATGAGGGAAKPPAHGHSASDPSSGGGLPLGPPAGAVAPTSGLSSAVGGITSTLGAGGGGLGTVASGLSSAVGGLTTPVSGLGATLGGTVQTVTNPLTSLLGGTGLPVVSNLPTTGSSVATLPSDLTGVAGTLVNGVAGGLGSLSTGTAPAAGDGSGTTTAGSSAAGTAPSTGIGCAVGTTLNDVASTAGSLLGGSGATGSAAGCS